MRRLSQAKNSGFSGLANELGFESVDAVKDSATATKQRSDDEKTELQKVQDRVKELEGASKATLDAANTRIVKAEAKVQAAALGVKPERIDAPLTLADLSGVTAGDDGEPDGAAITAAIEAVLETLPKLKGAAGSSTVGGGSNPPGGSNAQKNPWAKEHYNLTEQARILRENPTQAQQLIAAAEGQ